MSKDINRKRVRLNTQIKAAKKRVIHLEMKLVQLQRDCTHDPAPWGECYDCGIPMDPLEAREVILKGIKTCQELTKELQKARQVDPKTLFEPMTI